MKLLLAVFMLMFISKLMLYVGSTVVVDGIESKQEARLRQTWISVM